jgi:D-amino-acid dehydrogenase
MKVLILGSGVIGVTSAWYLAKAGHEVTVVDRQNDVALETSFANAGQVSPGYSCPWAGPGVPLKAAKWLLQDLSPLRVNPFADAKLYGWMMKLLLNCNETSYQRNKGRMLRLAEYSRDCLRTLRDDESLNYEHRTQGTLQVFRQQKQLIAVQNDIQALKQSNVNYQLLDTSGCIDYEPALSKVEHKLVGGLRLPDDETGDCYLFTQQLADKCKEIGVKFLFEHSIEKLVYQDNKIVAVDTDQGQLTADTYVMALGSYSPLLLNPLGIKLPVYPVKGYSLTVPVIDSSLSPTSTVMDETYKVAVTRLNDRIRVGGTAELTGFNTDLPPSRQANVDFVLNDLFAGAGDMSQAEYWTGLRPMTPDGTPIIGRTDIENLFVNTGHGTLGWTMATGSAKYLSDIMSEKTPDISTEGLGIERYK